MNRDHTTTGAATLVLSVGRDGRWSARMNVRAPGGHWRTHTNAWIEFGQVPQAPRTLEEVELMLLAVLTARHPSAAP